MGQKAVPSGSAYACMNCGNVFIDVKKNVRSRETSYINEDGDTEVKEMLYLSDECACCGRRRPEVADVQNAGPNEELQMRTFGVKSDSIEELNTPD